MTTARGRSANVQDSGASGRVEECISEALKMLDGDARSFAREFLLAFDCDISGDLVSLSNDAAVNLGDCGNFTVSAFDGDDPTATAAGLSMVSGWMPVFRSGGLMLGMHLNFTYGLDSFKSIPTMPSGGEPSVQNIGRFVQDENTGEMLFLSKTYAPGHRGDGLVSLIHTRYGSNGTRQQVFVRCNPALLGNRWRVENPTRFSDSAVVCTVMSQEPICRACGCVRTSSGNACCLVGDDLDRGPPIGREMDFSSFHGSASRHACKRARNYRGSLALSFRYSNQLPFQVRNERLSVAIRPFAGSKGLTILCKLRDASVQNRMLQGLEGNLPRCVVPVIGGSEVGDLAGLNAFVGSEQGPESDNAEDVIASNSHITRGLASDGQGGVDPSSIVAANVSSQVPEEGDAGFSKPPGGFPLRAQETNSSLDLFAAAVNESLSPLEDEGELLLLDSAQPSKADVVLEGNDEVDGVAVDIQHQNCGRDQGLTASQIERRKKNRESAARSNLRRRIYRDTLKRDLCEAREREEMLVKEQQRLQRENTVLKSVAANRWISSRRCPSDAAKLRHNPAVTR